MSLADAFEGSDSNFKAHVMHSTWGHLEQQRGSETKGWFTFSICAYGGPHVILGSDWGNLDDSPGLFEVMEDYMYRHGQLGVVTRLEGHVRRFKNGNYQIGGKRYVVNIKPKVNKLTHKVNKLTQI
jgi:hypothetical protein